MKRAVAGTGILLCLLVSLFIIYGCGGGGGGTAIYSGALVDSPIAGVEYITPTLHGVTDADGTFTYHPGEIIAFYLGEIYLGSSQGKDLITPLDLVPGATDVYDPVVTNIARFLQSLDADGIPDNGISISEDTINLLQEKNIHITSPEFDFDNNVEIQNLLSAIGNIPVSKYAAQQHLLKLFPAICACKNDDCVDISGYWTMWHRLPGMHWGEPDYVTFIQNGCEFEGIWDWEQTPSLYASIADDSLTITIEPTHFNGTIMHQGTITAGNHMEGTYTVIDGVDAGTAGEWKAVKDYSPFQTCP